MVNKIMGMFVVWCNCTRSNQSHIIPLAVLQYLECKKCNITLIGQNESIRLRGQAKVGLTRKMDRESTPFFKFENSREVEENWRR